MLPQEQTKISVMLSSDNKPIRGYRANDLIYDDWPVISPEIFKEIMEGFGVSGADGRDAVDLKSTTKTQREFESHLTHSEKKE